MASLQTCTLLVGLLLLGGMGSARADFSGSYFGDLVTASKSPMNQGVYNDTKGGYGTASFIDVNTAWSWEVDIFQAPVPKLIELVLTLPDLPQLLVLTTEPSSDGVSFGSIEYDALSSAIAASANPSASFKDGTIGVIAHFAKPAGAALLAPITDGSTFFNPVNAPPSPPTLFAPPPDQFSLHPGVTPDIFFSVLDGTQVFILQTGLTNAGNGTCSILIYDWKDGTYTWDLELNDITNPQSMKLYIFEDLWNTPFVFEFKPDQPWDPSTLSYSGSFTKDQLQAGLDAVGHSDASLNNQTPDLFLEIVDSGAAPAEDSVAAPDLAPAPAGEETVAVVANVRRRGLLQDNSTALEGNGTCGATQPKRVIGFIFDSKSRYKLKPVLKDTAGLPTAVKDYPVYVSGALLAVCFIAFVACYISGTLDAAGA